MSESVYNTQAASGLQVAAIDIDDHVMADATPRRKMFSSIPVSNEQYTKDNRGTSMAAIRAAAKYAKVGPGLHNIVKK